MYTVYRKKEKSNNIIFDNCSCSSPQLQCTDNIEHVYMLYRGHERFTCRRLSGLARKEGKKEKYKLCLIMKKGKGEFKAQ